jgi:hypothetical protein
MCNFTNPHFKCLSPFFIVNPITCHDNENEVRTLYSIMLFTLLFTLIYCSHVFNSLVRQAEVKQLIRSITYIAMMNNNRGQAKYIKGITHLQQCRFTKFGMEPRLESGNVCV